jgi:transposase InsO family protein
MDMAHSAAARRVRRELDQQLAATAAATGRDLVWTAQDRVVLSLIQAAIDRTCDLQRDYAAAEDAKTRAKLSAELRLLEANVERLLRRVKTDVPAPMSLRSVKAQRAAFARWSKDAG